MEEFVFETHTHTPHTQYPLAIRADETVMWQGLFPLDSLIRKRATLCLLW